MTDRICSCCGQGYNDNKRHDYELCYQVCKASVNAAKHDLDNALDCLEKASECREAQRSGRISGRIK